MDFQEQRGIGYCGLACVLCSYEDCPGCAVKIADGHDCSAGKCAAEKGLDGCYTCPDYDSCTEGMPHGKRSIAINHYAKNYGKQALIERLRINYENGITYHKPDKTAGDYDKLETEGDIQRLVRFGTHNPYIKCPVFHTENFMLRLVTLDDTEDLMKCYSDPKAQKLFNSANCTSDFCFKSLNELHKYIRCWLDAYERQEFIRYAIVDKTANRAVGTIEMFGMIGQYKAETGILRLDIISEFETERYLAELISLCITEFFLMFDVSHIVTLAIPEAENRIKSLKQMGFSVCDVPRPEYNFVYDRR